MNRKLKLLSLFTIGILLSACNNDTPKNESNKTTVETRLDKVIIKSYDSYPTALGCETIGFGADRKDCYLLPNGTAGEVMEWNLAYANHLSHPFAARDMFTESKVKILSGPSKGKTLYVAHAYINMQ